MHLKNMNLIQGLYVEDLFLNFFGILPNFDWEQASLNKVIIMYLQKVYICFFVYQKQHVDDHHRFENHKQLILSTKGLLSLMDGLKQIYTTRAVVINNRFQIKIYI